MNKLYKAIVDRLAEKTGADLKSDFHVTDEMSEKIYIIPPHRTRYLSEISENNRGYDKWVKQQSEIAQQLYSLRKSIDTLSTSKLSQKENLIKGLEETYSQVELGLDGHNKRLLKVGRKKCKRIK